MESLEALLPKVVQKRVFWSPIVAERLDCFRWRSERTSGLSGRTQISNLERIDRRVRLLAADNRGPEVDVDGELRGCHCGSAGRFESVSPSRSWVPNFVRIHARVRAWETSECVWTLSFYRGYLPEVVFVAYGATTGPLVVVGVVARVLGVLCVRPSVSGWRMSSLARGVA